MRFKLFAKIPVGTIVYKKVCEYDTYDKNTVLTCVVVGPGFCPGRSIQRWDIKKLKYVNTNKYAAEGNKCRVRAVVPIAAERYVGGRWQPCTDSRYTSTYDTSFTYHLNHIVSAPTFCDNKKIVCARGIHVFLTKARARNY